MVKCEADKCKTKASYGIKQEFSIRCKKHTKEDMVHNSRTYCIHEKHHNKCEDCRNDLTCGVDGCEEKSTYGVKQGFSTRCKNIEKRKWYLDREHIVTIINSVVCVKIATVVQFAITVEYVADVKIATVAQFVIMVGNVANVKIATVAHFVITEDCTTHVKSVMGRQFVLTKDNVITALLVDQNQTIFASEDILMVIDVSKQKIQNIITIAQCVSLNYFPMIQDQKQYNYPPSNLTFVDI
uniref:Uncharacterized protein n=1 Tax=Pithovirus LCPAC404 TaxID=2506597 RepID=A0A481ZCD9_9VIRU|nr:MAG: hypothetical protein LCPAC404_02880 [Pithovirus LCPAC404]